MFRKFLVFILLLGVLGSIAAIGVAYWAYNYFSRDLPNFETVNDYRPAVGSKIFAEDGTLIAEIFNERRYQVKLGEIPLQVRNAFLAAEDSSFYLHPGIDPISILRAFVKNLQSGSARQGGSTITQQVVKNLLLTKEKKIERKIKEAILAYRLERKLSKDEILEIYLNQIFLGNTAYGIKAAAQIYFHKELSEVTLAEAGMLAGLPQAPSKFSPITNLSSAKARQKYVLNQMVKANFASAADVDRALKEDVKVYKASRQGVYEAPYYVSEVQARFLEKFKDYILENDGLQIQTALNLPAYKIAQNAVRTGLRDVDKRRGWRGALAQVATYEEYKQNYKLPEILQDDEIYPALILEKRKDGVLKLVIGTEQAELSLKKFAWARKQVNKLDEYSWSDPLSLVKAGDIIEVSYHKNAEVRELQLDQTPEIEGALTLVDPYTGKVPVVIGGYDYNRSQFNRATQSLRQPGSTFKPVIYLSAVDSFGYTPATIVNDQARTFKIGDEVWTPGNYDETYMGPITLRTALEKSRNLVSVDIVSRIGVDAPIKYAKRLGLTSHIGRNLSISLGSSEVYPFELTRAYGVFAAGGLYHPSVFITLVKDRTGKVIYDYRQDPDMIPRQVINPATAFVMANMMKGVVENGTGYKIKALGKPAAGKTGTSNDQMDAWFIGYTPEWVCGVWTGFDLKRPIGKGETGGAVAAPIWLGFMQNYLAEREKDLGSGFESAEKQEAERLDISYVVPEASGLSDFTPPEGVKQIWVYKSSGQTSSAGAPGAIPEYFIDGTGPAAQAAESQEAVKEDYFNSEDL